ERHTARALVLWIHSWVVTDETFVTCTFVWSVTMHQPPPTQQVVECVDLRGEAAQVKVVVLDDSRIALTSSASRDEPVVLTVEQAALLRNQLGNALTAALRDARTTRGVDVS